MRFERELKPHAEPISEDELKEGDRLALVGQPHAVQLVGCRWSKHGKSAQWESQYSIFGPNSDTYVAY